MGSHRRPIRRSIVIRASVFLLLIAGAAIVNVAVAWGCASCAAAESEQSVGDHPWPFDAPANWPNRASFGWKHEGCALSVVESRAYERPEALVSTLHGVVCFYAGWPACSMTWCLYDDVESGTLNGWPDTEHGKWISGLTPIRVADDQWRFQRRLPVAPIWPGFAINTLFYAAILWGLFAAPLALRGVRRRRRIKRGLCPKCAYPVGESDVCTECGTPVKPRRKEP